MAEPKPFASLSAGLLASKGGARPAMRRQAHLPMDNHNGHDDLGWNDMGYDVDPHDGGHGVGLSVSRGLSPMAPSIHDELNAAADHANVQPLHENVTAAVHQAEPEVRLQQHAIEQALSPDVVETPVAEVPVAELAVVAPVAVAMVPRRKASTRARAGSRGNFAFTLRLDPQRHLRLRLASAANNQSTQQIMIALVDDFLANLPEIEAFAAKLPASKRAANQ